MFKAKKKIDKLKEEVVEKFQNASSIDTLKKNIKTGTTKLSDIATQTNGIFSAFLADNDLLKYLEGMTKSASSVYDKALDAEYLKSHVGGGDHRLFDGGHDIFSAWEKAREGFYQRTRKNANSLLLKEFLHSFSRSTKQGIEG